MEKLLLNVFIDKAITLPLVIIFITNDEYTTTVLRDQFTFVRILIIIGDKFRS